MYSLSSERYPLWTTVYSSLSRLPSGLVFSCIHCFDQHCGNSFTFYFFSWTKLFGSFVSSVSISYFATWKINISKPCMSENTFISILKLKFWSPNLGTKFLLHSCLSSDLLLFENSTEPRHWAQLDSPPLLFCFTSQFCDSSIPSLSIRKSR